MDNNYPIAKGKKDLMHAFVSLQHIVASINYAFAVYMVMLHAALETNEARLQLHRSPHPYRTQIDHLNRLVRNSEVSCHDML